MRTSLDWGDYLTLRITLVLGWLATLVSPGRAAWRWIVGGDLTLTNAIAPTVSPPTIVTDGGVQASWSNAATTWTFTSPTAGQYLGAVLPGILTSAVAGWLCVLIWRLVTSVQADAAFTGAGTRRLRLIGWALAALTAAMVVGELGGNMLVTAGLPTSIPQPALLTLDAVPFVPLGIALIVMVIAHAWSRGDALAEDAAGTI